MSDVHFRCFYWFVYWPMRDDLACFWGPMSDELVCLEPMSCGIVLLDSKMTHLNESRMQVKVVRHHHSADDADSLNCGNFLLNLSITLNLREAVRFSTRILLDLYFPIHVNFPKHTCNNWLLPQFSHHGRNIPVNSSPWNVNGIIIRLSRDIARGWAAHSSPPTPRIRRHWRRAFVAADAAPSDLPRRA